MRKLFFAVALCLSVSFFSFGQGVAVSPVVNATPDASAMLDVQTSATTTGVKGVLLPRVTTAQMNAILNPANGLIVYNTDALKFYYNHATAGANWYSIPFDPYGSGFWSLTGNTGLNSAFNYLGHNDDVDFQIRVNNHRAGLTGHELIDNIFFGYMAGDHAVGGNHNTGLGFSSLNLLTGGENNTAVGANALFNTTSYANTGIGSSALYSNTLGIENTAAGLYALNGNKLGNANTAIGTSAGASNTSDKNNSNTFLGYKADVAGIDVTNSTAIGAKALVNASNTIVLGNDQITSLQCHTTTVTSLSDRRLKTHIRDAQLGLSFINLLRPVDYNYIQPGQENILQTGFIAQEVEAAAAQSGLPDFHAVDKTNVPSGGYYGLRYAEMVTPLIKAVQELDAKNQNLQKENERLQKELAELKGLVSGIADKLNQLEAKTDNSGQKKSLTQK